MIYISGKPDLSMNTTQDDTGNSAPRDGAEQSLRPQSSLGMFQGVFFGTFMSIFIVGNALSGAILGSERTSPPRHRVIELFVVYVFSLRF